MAGYSNQIAIQKEKQLPTPEAFKIRDISNNL